MRILKKLLTGLLCVAGLSALAAPPPTVLQNGLAVSNGFVLRSGAFTGDASGATNLDASKLASGALPQERLPGNVLTNNEANQIRTLARPGFRSYIDPTYVGGDTNSFYLFGANPSIPDFTIDYYTAGVFTKRFMFTPEGPLVVASGFSDNGVSYPGTNNFSNPVIAVNPNNILSGSGAGLTSLNAGNLGSGFTPLLRMGTNAIVIAGANITIVTNYSAGLITYTISGTAGGGGPAYLSVPIAGTGVTIVTNTPGAGTNTYTITATASGGGILTVNGFGTNLTLYGTSQQGTNEASGVLYTYADGSQRYTNSTTGFSWLNTNGQFFTFNLTNTFIFYGDVNKTNAVAIGPWGMISSNANGGILFKGGVTYGTNGFVGGWTGAFTGLSGLTNASGYYVGEQVKTNETRNLYYTIGTRTYTGSDYFQGAMRVWDGTLVATNVTIYTNASGGYALQLGGNLLVNGAVNLGWGGSFNGLSSSTNSGGISIASFIYGIINGGGMTITTNSLGLLTMTSTGTGTGISTNGGTGTGNGFTNEWLYGSVAATNAPFVSTNTGGANRSITIDPATGVTLNWSETYYGKSATTNGSAATLEAGATINSANASALTNLTFAFPTNAAPIWTPALDGNQGSLHFVSATNFTLVVTNFPTTLTKYPSITISNSGANASTILVTCSGFCVLTNTYPTSTFYVTNLTAKRQQVRVDACFDPVGPMTNGIVTHLFDK